LKKDLRDHNSCTVEEGREVASAAGARAYLECSAKTQENLHEVFNEAIRVALGGGNRRIASASGCCRLL